MAYKFWDWLDSENVPFDSDQQIKIKSLRKKSNYYLSKYNTLSADYERLTKLLDESIETYGLGDSTISTTSDDVLAYHYYEYLSKTYKKTTTIFVHFREALKTINSECLEAERLHKKYYNLAIEEDKK